MPSQPTALFTRCMARAWPICLVVSAAGLSLPVVALAQTVTYQAGQVVDGYQLQGDGAFTSSDTFSAWVGSLRANVTEAAGEPATTTVQSVAINGRTRTYTAYTVPMKLNSVTVQDGLVTEYTLTGGWRIEARDDDTNQTWGQTGGVVTLSNPSVMLEANGAARVYGQLSGRSTTGAVIDFTGWLFQGQAQLSDSMPYSVQGWRASLPRLAITVGAFDAVAAAMGASEDNASWSVLQSTAANWGQLDAHVTNIPEPASSMLFGLGLLGLCQVRRR